MLQCAICQDSGPLRCQYCRDNGFFAYTVCPACSSIMRHTCGTCGGRGEIQKDL
jgi:DnaJ-class molecular chaperone